MGDTTVSILPVRPGTISADDKAMLREVGVIVIEHENPEELQLMTPLLGAFPRGPVLDAAMDVLAMFPTDSRYSPSQSDHMRSAFVAQLAAIRKKERANG
jgi:hypothetical protein